MIRRLLNHSRRLSKSLSYHPVPRQVVVRVLCEERRHGAPSELVRPRLAYFRLLLCNNRVYVPAAGTNYPASVTAELAGVARGINNRHGSSAASATCELEKRLSIKSLVNMQACVKYYAKSINQRCITSQTKSLG